MLSRDVFTDYLLTKENTTLEFNCIQHVANTLPVTMVDFDGNTVIPLFNMISGIDTRLYSVHKIRARPFLSRYSLSYN